MDLDEFLLNVEIMNRVEAELTPPEAKSVGTTSVAEEIRRKRLQWARDAQMYG